MYNDIMKFLNIEDKDIIISKILIDGNTKIIYLKKTLKVEYCPACSSRIHSKGKYNISDTSVHYIFLQYLNIKRLPLPEIISVDEVFLDIDYKHRYALVIMDFDSIDFFKYTI